MSNHFPFVKVWELGSSSSNGNVAIHNMNLHVRCLEKVLKKILQCPKWWWWFDSEENPQKTVSHITLKTLLVPLKPTVNESMIVNPPPCIKGTASISIELVKGFAIIVHVHHLGQPRGGSTRRTTVDGKKSQGQQPQEGCFLEKPYGKNGGIFCEY